MLNDLGIHYDMYRTINGVRHHVGMSFIRERLLGEDPLAFEYRMERLAERLAASGLQGHISTRYMAGSKDLACIDVLLEPMPASVQLRRPRGQRSGRKHTTI